MKYERDNPLSHWVNFIDDQGKNKAAQVKDLPTDLKNMYIEEISLSIEQRKKYLHEFRLHAHKTATSMRDLTPYEIEAFKCYLNTQGITYDVNNFFEDNGEYDWYTDAIEVDTWIWTYNNISKFLIDIYGWPGDNQDGAIFDRANIVITNSDQSLTATKNCPLILQERLLSFEEVRQTQKFS